MIRLNSGRILDFAQAPLVMGILNATPDSFYPNSRSSDVDAAAKRALAMIDEGADILDIGGESTRPGARYVSARIEMERVVPVIEAIRRQSDVAISVDTRKAVVARRAIAAGADLINDISGLRDDPEMAPTAGELRAPVVIMHMQGTPSNMQEDPHYDDALGEIIERLMTFVEFAVKSGIRKSAIIVDPGIGFGKRVEDNLALIKGIPQLKRLGYPVLIGLSRKGFLGVVTGGRTVDERLPATLAANAYAALAGADILRVHDVRETVDMKRTLGAIATAD
jgi:dihydropteroate synthase